MGFSRAFEEAEERAGEQHRLETKLASFMASSLQGNQLDPQQQQPQQQQQQQEHPHQIPNHHHQQQQQQQQQHHLEIQYGMMQSSSSNIPSANFIGSSKDSGAYDLGELDQALFLYLDGQQDHHHHHHQASHHVQDQRHQITRDLAGFGRRSQEKHVQQD